MVAALTAEGNRREDVGVPAGTADAEQPIRARMQTAVENVALGVRILLGRGAAALGSPIT